MLRTYSDDHFRLLTLWITDPYILFQFSGTYFSYPLTREQIDEYLIKFPERRFYIGYDPEDTPYAFGEIIPKPGLPPRLGRLLVGDPEKRGKGLGGIFVRELIARIRHMMNPAAVDLFVLENNLPAIRCYEKIGFSFLPGEKFDLVFEEISYRVKKMRLSLESE
jgi:RimJ/RimL family protein N-acetyltransferase